MKEEDIDVNLEKEWFQTLRDLNIMRYLERRRGLYCFAKFVKNQI